MAGGLTSIDGIAVGHCHDDGALTGCTAVIFPPGTVCSADVRGGGPATRETDLLAPQAMVQHVDAICLSGGSAFGLAAAGGVAQWLRERGRGFATPLGIIPIVPGASLFDLGLGRADTWPDAATGYAACQAAHTGPVAEGSVGAGVGAAVGKVAGMGRAMKGGVGTASLTLRDGVTVAALAITNAWGDVYARAGGIVAGARHPEGGFVDTARLLATQEPIPEFAGGNTTLAVVATDARLDKSACRKLAEMAQDGMARAIRPVHTPFDGDIVFAAATGARQGPGLAGLVVIGSVAADLLAEAIERSVTEAHPLGGLPSARRA